MGGLDVEVINAILARSLDILKLSANEQREVLRLIQGLQRELVQKLSEGNLTEFSKARLQSLLNECDAMIAQYYGQAQGQLALTLNELGTLEAQHTADVLTSVLATAKIEATIPSATVLKRLVSNIIIDGTPLAGYWERQAGDTAYRFAQQVRMGIVAGETNQQIISRIIGKSGEMGVMDITRRNAAALVQTATLTVANTARSETYHANADIMYGERWVSSLDSHTCISCAARDGLKWDLDGKPVGHKLPYIIPALHVNCRCALTAWLKPIILKNGAEIDLRGSQRASTDGSVSSKLTFSDWLASKSPEFQDAQLGVGKAELFRQGKLTLADMLDMKGQEMTLVQLKEKYRIK